MKLSVVPDGHMDLNLIHFSLSLSLSHFVPMFFLLTIARCPVNHSALQQTASEALPFDQAYSILKSFMVNNSFFPRSHVREDRW